MSRKYKFHNPTAPYFVSFATVNWIAVFIREIYFNVLAESITYSRNNKGLELYAYCFMPNHVHLIFRSKNGTPSALLRDIKKYTAKKLLSTIKNHRKESRKEWLLEMFEKAGKHNCNITKYQFWQHHNHPIELWSTAVIRQKVMYIHQNPVKAGFVCRPVEWKWSSARNIANYRPVLEIDDIGFI